MQKPFRGVPPGTRGRCDDGQARTLGHMSMSATLAPEGTRPLPKDPQSEPQSEPKRGEGWGSLLAFLAKLVLAVVLFRTLLFAPFTIPSESMMPLFRNGDYLIAAKWPYGYSRLSLPFAAPLPPGRIFAHLPERGDVAIFRHPVDDVDYIKRVIGLPGDTVEMRRGRLILNGRIVPQTAKTELSVPLSANTSCHPAARERQTPEGSVCDYDSAVETLPNGRSYRVIDLGTGPADEFGPVTVPEGRLFVMGDNRDNSQDSRYPAIANGGVGLVPTDLLVGRASMILFSTDGSAEWANPWTWFTAARWDRIGDRL